MLICSRRQGVPRNLKIPIFVDGSKQTVLRSRAVVPAWLVRDVPAGSGNMTYADETKEIDISPLLDQDTGVTLKFKVPSLVPTKALVEPPVELGDNEVLELIRDAGCLPEEASSGTAGKKPKKLRATKQAGAIKLLSEIFGPEAAVAAARLDGTEGQPHRVPKRAKAPADVAHLLT